MAGMFRSLQCQSRSCSGIGSNAGNCVKPCWRWQVNNGTEWWTEGRR